MGKKIVGAFKTDFSMVEFYTIIEDVNEYTVLKKQTTDEICLWNNKTHLFANLGIIKGVEEIGGWKEFIKNVECNWHYDMVFFWATSKFVTEYGLPGYDLLVDLYKRLIEIRQFDYDYARNIEMLGNYSIISQFRYRFYIWKVRRHQQKVLNKIIKEFEVIW